MINRTENEEIVRPDHGYGFYSLPPGTANAAREELLKKTLAVAAGLDQFSAVDKLAYYFLKDSGLLQRFENGEYL